MYTMKLLDDKGLELHVLHACAGGILHHSITHSTYIYEYREKEV